MSIGVPVKLLHESLGHTITVELKTGQLYRGKLSEGKVMSIAVIECTGANGFDNASSRL